MAKKSSKEFILFPGNLKLGRVFYSKKEDESCVTETKEGAPETSGATEVTNECDSVVVESPSLQDAASTSNRDSETDKTDKTIRSSSLNNFMRDSSMDTLVCGEGPVYNSGGSHTLDIGGPDIVWNERGEADGLENVMDICPTDNSIVTPMDCLIANILLIALLACIGYLLFLLTLPN